MPSIYASLSVTEAQAFQVLGDFLQAMLPPTCQITRGAINRVAEPLYADFVTMMQIGQKRLAWNDTTFVDNILTGSIAPAEADFTGSVINTTLAVLTTPTQPIVPGSALSGVGVAAGTTIVQQLTGAAGGVGTYQVSIPQTVTAGALSAEWGVLTVSAFTQQQGPLTVGTLITDGAAGLVTAGTLVLQQLSGTSGGIGTYAVSDSQTVASETMYGGLRLDLVHTDMTVQLDVHGPNSGDNTKLIEGLFFSEVASDQFDGTGIDVHPLYCEDARQVPFINDQQQIEWRYSMDAHIQINPSISSWQQFADQIEVNLHIADLSVA